MRFAFIDQYDGKLSQGQLCELLEVTDRGYRSWRSRPISQRQRDEIGDPGAHPGAASSVYG